MSANAGTLFQTADMLPAAPSRNEELEALVRKQFDEICEKDALIESMRAAGSTARPARPSPDTLKDSERLMLLARIGDLTLLNQALEIELREAIQRQQLIIDTYLDVDLIIFDENNENCMPARDAAKRRAIASKELRSQIMDLEDRIFQLECSQPEKEAQPKQISRGEVLLALLAANGGKMMAIDARHKLEISETAFSLLLKTLSKKIEINSFHSDRRKNVILLK
jgi:hypothetical protein